MIVCIIYYRLGLGHLPREAMAQTHRHMDIATYRLNRPMGPFSENVGMVITTRLAYHLPVKIFVCLSGRKGGLYYINQKTELPFLSI